MSQGGISFYHTRKAVSYDKSPPGGRALRQRRCISQKRPAAGFFFIYIPNIKHFVRKYNQIFTGEESTRSTTLAYKACIYRKVQRTGAVLCIMDKKEERKCAKHKKEYGALTLVYKSDIVKIYYEYWCGK